MTLTRALCTIGIFAAAVLLVGALGLKPLHAMGTDNPPAPTDDGGKKKKKKPNAVEQPQYQLATEKFLHDYRAARKMILAGHYQSGIAAMHAIGYAYRKLGQYEDSKIWYEKALAADPNHVRTWSYYGMWQTEQGNRLKALDDLQKVKLICGNTSCQEYRQLKAVIEGKASY